MVFVTKKKEVIGTLVSISLDEKHKDILKECFKELKRIENKYSRFLQNSYLSKLNKNLNKWQDIDDETTYILKKAIQINKETKGYFNVCIKKDLEKIGYDSNYSFKKKILIRNPFGKKGFKISENKIFLHEEIDIGGLGKGYAVDRLCFILDSKSIEDYFINAGGDIFSKGKHTAYLENPNNSSFVIGEVEIENSSLCSSSSNRRRWKYGHHLINPHTRKPAENRMKALFIEMNKAIEADAYATGLFCMGFEKAIEISKEKNLKVILISDNDKIYVSENFNVKFY